MEMWMKFGRVWLFIHNHPWNWFGYYQHWHPFRASCEPIVHISSVLLLLLLLLLDVTAIDFHRIMTHSITPYVKWCINRTKLQKSTKLIIHTLHRENVLRHSITIKYKCGVFPSAMRSRRNKTELQSNRRWHTHTQKMPYKDFQCNLRFPLNWLDFWCRKRFFPVSLSCGVCEASLCNSSSSTYSIHISIDCITLPF